MGVMEMAEFEALIGEAQTQPITGWGFSFLYGRSVEEELSWNYKGIVQEAKAQVTSLLDMGTGGGEFLSSLAPLPQDTCATEGYGPNVAVAQRRLEPLDVSVAYVESDDHLPFEEDRFELIINRHESYAPTEVHRILRSGGAFITQQVGGQNDNRINEFLQAPVNEAFAHWKLDFAAEELRQANFQVIDACEAFPVTRFYDVGAVVYYLRMVEWQIPGFTVERYAGKLRELHHFITSNGCFEVPSHRFLIMAVSRD